MQCQRMCGPISGTQHLETSFFFVNFFVSFLLIPRFFVCLPTCRPEDLHRIRVEHMERQLANLTGLVQKALVNQNPQIAPLAVPTLDSNYLVVPSQMQGMCPDSGTSSESESPEIPLDVV